MSGTFFCVGVGPGDPELLTFKAARKIMEGDILILPISDKSLTAPIYEEAEKKETEAFRRQCVAYQIVQGQIEGVREKAKLYLPMPMIKDKELLKQIHDAGAEAIASLLDRGKMAVFITLGDPSLYSTCLYVQKRLKIKGYHTELIPGVPSFCAVAARLGMGLAENKEQLHVIPASYGVEEALLLPGTKVLMKAGKKMPEVKRAVKSKNLEIEMVENCGMPQERIYKGVEEIPENAGYYSLLIVKEGKR
ncbi:precorrin-2 C(20)-methyltransferase [Mediterraneibacter massiliensis]|uniref:precorrin-2 C(20)-methyltransferase n=1 Tax=Mediterraneibacter massiliensis TaxID=1720300 RepID=UPI0024AE2B36|nr:precorrin-2 C(20)-methyltransferase [Mediterraneibacter massiliensis]